MAQEDSKIPNRGTPSDAEQPSVNNQQEHSDNKNSFMDLGDDIHHLICAELYATSWSSILALARVSQSLDAIATPYLCRNVVLDCGTEGSQKRRDYDKLLRMLCFNGLAKHVRHLQVEDLASPADLEAILDLCGEKLEHFSWNANARMSHSILQLLQTKWPDLRLHINNYECHNVEPAVEAMERALLSSPKLVSLEYVVFTRQDHEWEHLSQNLAAGGRCKSLQLSIKYYGSHNRGFLRAPPEQPEATTVEETQFPPLEELIIRARMHALDYIWADELNDFVHNCMEGWHLRRLDLGDTCKLYLFEGLAGRHPKLEYLRFGLPDDDSPVDPLIAYLDALEGLRGLEVSNLRNYVDQLWPQIRKQRNTLKELILKPTLGQWQHWYLDASLLDEVARDFPLLEYFGFDVPFEKEPSSTSHETRIDKKCLSHLTNLHLKHLELWLFLPEYATPFARPHHWRNASFPALDVEGTQKAGAAIADSISAAQKHPLQALTMHISRQHSADRSRGYDDDAKMQLRRRERDDVESLGIEKYEFVKMCQWKALNLWDPEDLEPFEIPRQY